MKIHLLRFASGQDFLKAYREMQGLGGVCFPSRVALEKGETFVLEINFPPLPNRVLVKAKVVQNDRDLQTVEVKFLDGEQLKRDFLLDMATKDPAALKRNRPAHRRHRRFPVDIPVTWQVKGVEYHHEGHIEDLSGGGMFVRTEWTPPVGTELKLTLRPTPQKDKISVLGRVTWVSQGIRAGGMGIHFRQRNRPAMRQIRRLIREIGHSGEVDLNELFPKQAPSVPQKPLS